MPGPAVVQATGPRVVASRRHVGPRSDYLACETEREIRGGARAACDLEFSALTPPAIVRAVLALPVLPCAVCAAHKMADGAASLATPGQAPGPAMGAAVDAASPAGHAPAGQVSATGAVVSPAQPGGLSAGGGSGGAMDVDTSAPPAPAASEGAVAAQVNVDAERALRLAHDRIRELESERMRLLGQQSPASHPPTLEALTAGDLRLQSGLLNTIRERLSHASNRRDTLKEALTRAEANHADSTRRYGVQFDRMTDPESHLDDISLGEAEHAVEDLQLAIDEAAERIAQLKWHMKCNEDMAGFWSNLQAQLQVARDGQNLKTFLSQVVMPQIDAQRQREKEEREGRSAKYGAYPV